PTTHRPTALLLYFPLFFFPPTAPPDIYTLSLHDALPIFFTNAFRPKARWNASRGFIGNWRAWREFNLALSSAGEVLQPRNSRHQDRKSTRLNSSHVSISYAVFCLKKKKKQKKKTI